MAARHVVDPRGVAWTIRRRWMPHAAARLARLRGRDAMGTAADVGWGLGDLADVPVIGIAFVAPALLVLLLFTLFAVPLLVAFVVGLIAAVVIAVVAGVLRLVLSRPWTVEATSDGADARREWEVQGFRLAGAWRDEVAERFVLGHDPTPERFGPHPR